MPRNRNVRRPRLSLDIGVRGIAVGKRTGGYLEFSNDSANQIRPLRDSSPFRLRRVRDVVAVVLLIEQAADFLAETREVLLLERRVGNFGGSSRGDGREA